MGKVYLTAKLGKSLKFNPNNWAVQNGDNETPMLITKMAELHPDDTFIVIGKNDLAKARDKFSIPSNIVDVYEGCTKEEKLDVNYVWNKLKDKKVDGCFIVAGPVGSTNIPEKAFKRNLLKKGKKEFAKSLFVFENYAGPIMNYLNESGIDWIMLLNDPRYCGFGYDLMNKPKKILSQYNETIVMKTFDNWEDQNMIKKQIPGVYAGLEKICIIDMPLHDCEKTDKFTIALNEGNNGVKSRYPELKKYVLDHMDDVSIYGAWDENTVGDDKRFKGLVKHDELHSIMKNTRYTFIIPIKEGWSTAKWVEMVGLGIIPFMHPSYDAQNNTGVPDFIRINTPEELQQKIQILEDNPEARERLINHLRDMIREDRTGRPVIDRILSEVPELNISGEEFSKHITSKEEVGLDDW